MNHDHHERFNLVQLKPPTMVRGSDGSSGSEEESRFGNGGGENHPPSGGTGYRHAGNAVASADDAATTHLPPQVLTGRHGR